MNITSDKIQKNKELFISLLQELKTLRPGAKVDELIVKLESSDWFEAPASTKYHGACKGGLCQHSLNVYKHLLDLSKEYDDIDRSSIIIVALLHDFSKMNVYELSYRNKKVYSENGSKSDNGGRFDWISEQSYTLMDEANRFIYGNHEETSEFMARTFIPLTIEESVAILYHHGGMGWDSSDAAAQVLNRYKLPLLLHCADMISAYVDEK